MKTLQSISLSELGLLLTDRNTAIRAAKLAERPFEAEVAELKSDVDTLQKALQIKKNLLESATRNLNSAKDNTKNVQDSYRAIELEIHKRETIIKTLINGA